MDLYKKKKQDCDYEKSAQMILEEIRLLRVDVEQKLEGLIKLNGNSCPQFDGSLNKTSLPRDFDSDSIVTKTEDVNAVESTKNRIQGEDPSTTVYDFNAHDSMFFPNKEIIVENTSSTFYIPTVAMNHPSDKCMFDDICRDKPIDLHVKDSLFHLYTGHFAIELPTVHVCNRAFVFTSMPFSNVHVQMIIVRLLMEHFQRNVRSYVYWNWHAHAKISQTDALLWKERMTDFIGTLKEQDELVVYAPYKDDKTALNLCKTSIVIHEMRSLEDIALLRFHRYISESEHQDHTENTLETLDAHGVVNYIRSILMHQRYWENHSDVLLSHRQLKLDGGLAFSRRICREYMSLSNADLCTDTLLLDIISHEEVKRAKKIVKKQNDFLAQLYYNMNLNVHANADSILLLNQIQELFRAWTTLKISNQII